ncbi:uncharacterized protein PV07_01341 [Cladophialophora immunda]|uniref:Uncharacterized protein n=1 Tax=Cladophialophora immunda TaxID=569365 RepID=A0A0D2DFV3_9EURO|nr:uncharacterized protein PV07_01341 [Cladophialophora immunda]KIW34564.1 hypothetical protein PV07_01341 [Cladophialophora immunda]
MRYVVQPAPDQQELRALANVDSDLTLWSSSWLPEFNGPRDGFDYENENITYLTRQRRLGQEGDLAEVFMLDLDDTDGYSFQVDRVRSFLNGTTERTIRPDDAEDGTSLLYGAWLDERCYERGSRAYCNPLTAEGLSHQLTKPRFRRRRLDTKTSSNASTPPFFHGLRHQASIGSVGLRWALVPYHEPDAARRLIFITDLDSETATVLMKTASYHQARPLRHALYHHITSRALITVNISSRLPSNFELAFHMPFYAWRNSRREDHRTCTGGGPLRETLDVSFLNREREDPPQFLCKAHFTCVISGSDDRHWVAYFFADTYFDGQDEARETVHEYHKDKDTPEGMNADPLTYGNTDADVDPIWDPRKYFLTIFSYRLRRIAREWSQVVTRVEESVVGFRKSHDCLLSRPTDCRSSQEDAGHSANLLRYYDWVTQTDGTSMELEKTLGEMVDANEAWDIKYSAVFHGLPQSGDEPILLPEIKAIFDELKLLKKRLTGLRVKCKALSKKLALHLQLEGVNAGKTQNQQGRDNNYFSWIMMIYVSPMGFTISTFSMQTISFPHVGLMLPWFILLLSLFCSVGFLVHTTVFRRWPLVKSWISQLWILQLCIGKYDMPQLLRWSKKPLDDLEAGPPCVVTVDPSSCSGRCSEQETQGPSLRAVSSGLNIADQSVRRRSLPGVQVNGQA